MSNIITITTDWGMSDSYIAIFKAMLWKYNENQRIVDITHMVKRNNIIDAIRDGSNDDIYFNKFIKYSCESLV